MDNKNMPLKFDESAFDRLREAGGAASDKLIGRLADMYTKQVPEMVKELRVNLDKRCYEDLARYAHTLKSTNLNMGCNGLAEVAANIEAAILDEKMFTAEQLDTWIQEIENILPSCLSWVGSHVPQKH